MPAELHIDEPLDEGYWESLGMEGDQARPSDPFSSPPPGAGANPFAGHGGPTGRSRYEAVWLVTCGGVEFIDVFIGDKEHDLVFLYEVLPGRFNVGTYNPKTKFGEFWAKDVGYLEAKRLAQEEAAELSVDAGANARWRQDWPSPGQLNFAAKLGIDTSKLETKGEVSDAINVETASRVLDPKFAKER